MKRIKKILDPEFTWIFIAGFLLGSVLSTITSLLVITIVGCK